ncbi:cleavage stimulation factor subunit 3-like [Oscarella lobularis]|uniref:cleavage stimulation factor subunit 3-like n=1 Tax=Oscarella lobularis TaxID=121494 RepID=UPI0033133830
MADATVKIEPGTRPTGTTTTGVADAIVTPLADLSWSRNEAGRKCEESLKTKPYDVDSWNTLIREAQPDGIDRARILYERLVKWFPMSGRFWRIYIEHEMRARNYDRVEKLFQRCLLKVLSLDLWRTYLAYVKETKGNLPVFREKMTQAYEFTLDKVGLDFGAIEVWMEYVNFLRTGDVQGTFAENQKITAVRKVFQKAIATPLLNIEAIWKAYTQFEQSTNMTLAKKLLDEKSRDYMSARRVVKEYEALTRGILRGTASVPFQGTTDDFLQMSLWKKYILWEKSNPLHLEDSTAIAKRVTFAYEQYLLAFGHNPSVWCEAALYMESVGKDLAEKGDMATAKVWNDDVGSLYERALSIVPKCPLIYFAYADFEEAKMKNEKVHSIYSRLLEIEDVDPSLAYVQYMRFTRRAEGIKAARTVFKKAREDARTKSQVYVAAALMEYYCTKDKNIALKIFELGLKKYSDDVSYGVAYVDYLSHLNEDNNTRVLFERLLTSMPSEKSSPLWTKFLDFETNVGDLPSILNVEKRRNAVLQEQFKDRENVLLIDRYKYMGMFPCSPLDLRAMGHPDFIRPSTSFSGARPDGATAAVSRALAAPFADLPTTVSYPLPDLSQMRPFKPTVYEDQLAGGVPGGIFPPPRAVAEALTILPPPAYFEGPYVNVDDLMTVMLRSDLRRPSSGLKDDMLKENGTAGNAEKDEKRRQRKRVAGGGKRDESDEEGAAPPIKDIYRSRQQKRANVVTDTATTSA